LIFFWVLFEPGHHAAHDRAFPFDTGVVLIDDFREMIWAEASALFIVIQIVEIGIILNYKQSVLILIIFTGLVPPIPCEFTSQYPNCSHRV